MLSEGLGRVEGGHIRMCILVHLCECPQGALRARVRAFLRVGTHINKSCMLLMCVLVRVLAFVCLCICVLGCDVFVCVMC